MRLVIPWTYKHPATVESVPADTDWLWVGDDVDNYWRAMCEVWERAVDEHEDVFVLEHDCIYTPEIAHKFDACPEPWCGNPYHNICHWECMEAWANQLGCVRFRAELIAAVPDAVSSIPEDQRDWHNLCDSIAGNKIGGMPAPVREHSLRGQGFTHHWHFPPVRHDHGNAEIMVDWQKVIAEHG